MRNKSARTKLNWIKNRRMKRMNKDGLLEGLVALFSQNSKKELSKEDKDLIANVVGRYEAKAEAAPVVEAKIEPKKEEVATGSAPVKEEVKVEAASTVEPKAEIKSNAAETPVAQATQNTANEIVEKEADTQFISKKDFEAFKSELLSMLKPAEKVEAPEKDEPKTADNPIGLQKGDPGRYNTKKDTSDASKYMG
jgi:glutamyl/glutaminyl-tRNA synthetase